MRNLNCVALSGMDAESIDGSTIGADQLVSASFQAYFGDNQATGTFKLQASNDVPPAGYAVPLQDFQPTHWVDIPTKTVSVTAGTSALIAIPQTSYRWVRPVWTNTATGAQTIETVAAGYGNAQAVTAICIDDVAGSLNSAYWLIYAVHDSIAYYVWYNVNGAGIDPAVPGKTGIRVNIATNATATQIAAASGVAMSAVGAGLIFNAFNSDETLIVYNIVFGPATGPSDGPGGHATGFTIDLALPGVNPGLVQLGNHYFFVNASVADGGAEYYFWFDVDGGGVDPLVPGKTGVSLPIFSTDDANGVANAVLTALQSLTEFENAAVTPADSNVVTFDNVSAGPFTPASDFNTTFTFEVNEGGSSTVTVTMDAVSY